VDNRAGAGGNIGMEAVAKAQPDGYTVLLTSGSLIINPLVYAKVQFDPIKDFAPISVVANGAQVLVANPSVEAKTVKEMVALLKSKPGSLSLGTPGIGTVGHLTTELLKTTAGVNIVHVPYKGSGAAITDLLGGQIQLMLGGPSSVIQHLRSGRLKGIAVASPKREPGLEDIPTFAEAGYKEVEATNWYGIFMPAGTPPSITGKFHSELVRIMEMADTREKFSNSGFEAAYSTPERFSKFLIAEQGKWRRVVKASGARVE
jgi:tripartite-type tricarboxylate transporter receptor subunit TctC